MGFCWSKHRVITIKTAVFFIQFCEFFPFRSKAIIYVLTFVASVGKRNASKVCSKLSTLDDDDSKGMQGTASETALLYHVAASEDLFDGKVQTAPGTLDS